MTLKQMLVNAIREGKTPYPEETADELAAEFGFDGKNPEKWTAEEKEQIRKTLPEVRIWPDLAEQWLDRQWERLSEESGS